MEKGHKIEHGEGRALPLISVVTVVYNDLGGLRKTVDSVNSQTWELVEHVVVDGASGDGAADYLAELKSQVDTVWISEPDDGIYDAMNKGVGLASGDLLVFMNAGDVFSRDSVLKFVASDWTTSRWQWGFGCVRTVNSRGGVVGCQVQYPFRKRAIQLGKAFVPHQASYISRVLFDDLNGFRTDIGVSGDQDLLIRAGLLEQPAQWLEFLADFELGGAHSKSSELSRQLRWHRIRRDANIMVLNCNLADLAYSYFFGSYLNARSSLRAVRNFMRPVN